MNIFTSWRTGLIGLGQIGWGAFNLSIGNFPIAITSIMDGVSNLFTRDNAVTSKQAGAE